MDELSCDKFVREMKTRGYSVSKSNFANDAFRHIDYILTKDGKTITVDLKSQKRGQSSGLFLIELLNVRGDLGWLFGKATHICFDTEKGFLFVNRSALYRTVQRIFGFYASKSGVAFDKRTTFVSTPEAAIAPTVYCRSDRPREAVSFISEAILLEHLDPIG